MLEERESYQKQNHKEEDRHEKVSSYVVRLNQLFRIVIFRNGAAVVTPKCFYRGTSPTISPGFPLKACGNDGIRGVVEIIASGLDLPTAMTFGPDGNLYVSNWGFGPPIGQVLKIELAD